MSARSSRSRKDAHKKQPSAANLQKETAGSLPGSLPGRAKSYLTAALVALVTFVVYLSALKNGFVYWDDHRYVYENPHIRALDLTFFRWALFDFYDANWHPLTWFSHAVDYALWGLNPSGHHLMSIIIHSLNSALVVLLSISLFGRTNIPGIYDRGKGYWRALAAAAFAGLLYGLHPVHVESVAWASERKDLLCAFFYLLSVISYLQYAQSKEPEPPTPFRPPSRRYYLACVIFFALALMSKPMAISLPVALLIADWGILGRLRTATRSLALLEKLPLLALGTFSAFITLVAQHHGGAVRQLGELPIQARLVVGAGALSRYLWNSLWPLDLSPFYPYPAPGALWTFGAGVAILASLAITAAAALLVKRQPIWLAAWGFFVVTLLPVLGIVQVGEQAMADRYLYLPILSICILAGLGLLIFSGKRHGDVSRSAGLPTVLLSAALLTILAFSAITVKQISVWRTTTTLWERVAQVLSSKDAAAYRNSYLVYFNLGSAYFKEDRLAEAESATRKAVSLNPDHAESRFNLGTIWLRQQKTDDAAKEFEEVVRLDPEYAEAYMNLGVYYMRKMRTEEALRMFEKALQLKPDYQLARVNLGLLYIRQNRLSEAEGAFSEVIKTRPDFADAHYELARTYALQGRYDQAIGEFEVTLRLKPDHAKARDGLRSLQAPGKEQRRTGR